MVVHRDALIVVDVEDTILDSLLTNWWGPRIVNRRKPETTRSYWASFLSNLRTLCSQPDVAPLFVFLPTRRALPQLLRPFLTEAWQEFPKGSDNEMSGVSEKLCAAIQWLKAPTIRLAGLYADECVLATAQALMSIGTPKIIQCEAALPRDPTPESISELKLKYEKMGVVLKGNFSTWELKGAELER